MSLRDDILAMNDLDERIVKVKQWKNKKILMRAMSGAQRVACVEASRVQRGKETDIDGNKLSHLSVIVCACDPETSKPIFNMSDLPALQEKNAAALETLAVVAFELSGMGEEALESAEKK